MIKAQKCQGTTLVVPIAPIKDEGFSPCDVETFPTFGPEQFKGISAHVLRNHSNRGGRSLFQTERMANLLIDVLRSAMRSGKVAIHEFVVMPNHIHILMTVPGDSSLEKAMQLVKGGFSFRAKREVGFPGEIWQRGFSDVRVPDEMSFKQHQEYIANNPVKAGLSISPEEFPFGSVYLKKQKRAGAEAQHNGTASGTTEVVP